MFKLLILWSSLWSIPQGNAAFFSDSGKSSGNKLLLLPTGEETHKARLNVINGARRSLYVSAFSFYDEPSTKEILDALCLKSSREGIETRILADDSASGTIKKYEKYLLNCGVHLLFYNPRHGPLISRKVLLSKWGFDHSLNIIHEKLLIADGETVVMGGSNYGTPYRYHHRDNDKKGQYHDLNLKADGPAACYFHSEFARNWRRTVEQDLSRFLRFRAKEKSKRARNYGPDKFIECEGVQVGDAEVIPIYANSLFSQKRPILKRYIEAIENSDKITLVAPYFQPLDEFMDALLAAKKRGAKIRILINSEVSNDEPLSVFATFGLIKRLLASNIEIYLWPKKSTLHRKFGLFEGQGKRWGYVGSDNLSGRAQNYNSEAVMFSNDESFVEQLEQELELDFAGAPRLTEEMRWKIYSSFGKWLRKIQGVVRPYM